MTDKYDPAGEHDAEEKHKRLDLEQAFGRIIRERRDVFCRMAKHWVGQNNQAEDIAEDLVQDVLLKCWNALSHYSAERLEKLNLGGYIYRAVVNESRARRNPGPRDIPLTEEIYTLAEDEGLEPEKVLDRKQGRATSSGGRGV
jgi:DNA-directed RNA polymerase specialized sigma24 family protein